MLLPVPSPLHCPYLEPQQYLHSGKPGFHSLGCKPESIYSLLSTKLTVSLTRSLILILGSMVLLLSFLRLPSIFFHRFSLCHNCRRLNLLLPPCLCCSQLFHAYPFHILVKRSTKQTPLSLAPTSSLLPLQSQITE